MAASGTWTQTMGGYRAQIVENCSFFSARDAQIGVIVTREPLGNFKAVVIRAEKDGQRDALLSSESAETVQKAYELLFIKSTEAVHNYLNTNGFAFAPCSKKVSDVVDDDDDGVSSVSSASEIMGGDMDKDLEDSALSFDAESAYESMTEDEAYSGYDRARGTHTSRNSRIHRPPMWVRCSSRSPRREDPDFRHEPLPRSPHYPPQNNFPLQRRRPSLVGPPNPKAAGPIARHVPPGPTAPSAAPGPVQPGAWKSAPMRPPGTFGNVMYPVYADHVPMSGLRPHPSHMLPVQAPPLPPTGRLAPPPPATTLPQPAQARHVVNNVNLNGNSHAGSAPALSPPVSIGHSTHPTTTPPVSSSSHSSPALSTPTHAAGPNKPPPPPAPAPAQLTPPPPPAAIDCRLCIKSRMPGTGDVSEQRMVVRTLPTRAHVRAAALRYVEYNPSLFRHLGPAYAAAVPPSFKADGGGGGAQGPGPADKHLRANVTRVVFGTGAGGESYDLTTYGEDDLSRLCASVAGGRAGAGELPLFEVVVTNVGPAGSFFTLA